MDVLNAAQAAMLGAEMELYSRIRATHNLIPISAPMRRVARHILSAPVAASAGESSSHPDGCGHSAYIDINQSGGTHVHE